MTMASHAGRQPTRWSGSRRTTRKGGAVPPPPAEDSDSRGPAVPVAAPDTADIYRSLFDRLRGVFGGSIDDTTADAIAFAASELYHRDVEPRRWEHKTAQDILDILGVPRANTFARYSLADRLLLLRRSASPDRTDRAHALFADLGAPELGEGGEPLSLRHRLEWLLDGVGPVVPGPGQAGDNGGRDDNRPGEDRKGGGEVSSDGPATQQVVNALETIRQAANAEDTEPSDASSPPAGDRPAGYLVGLGTVIATIQEELIQLRHAVQTVQSSLDEVLDLLRTGTGDGVTAAPVTGAPAVDAPTIDAGTDTSGASAVEGASEEDHVGEGDHVGEEDEPPVALPPAVEETGKPPLPEPAVAPGDVTQPVPVIDGGPSIAEVTATKRRRRGLLILILIAVVIGLLVAGMAILISTVGWNELRREMGAAADAFATVTAHPVVLVRPPAWAG